MANKNTAPLKGLAISGAVHATAARPSALQHFECKQMRFQLELMPLGMVEPAEKRLKRGRYETM
jgi:hypothetical protein